MKKAKFKIKKTKWKKFRIDVEDMPTEIEARDIDEALKIAHENITILAEEDVMD